MHEIEVQNYKSSNQSRDSIIATWCMDRQLKKIFRTFFTPLLNDSIPPITSCGQTTPVFRSSKRNHPYSIRYWWWQMRRRRWNSGDYIFLGEKKTTERLALQSKKVAGEQFLIGLLCKNQEMGTCWHGCFLLVLGVKWTVSRYLVLKVSTGLPYHRKKSTAVWHEINAYRSVQNGSFRIYFRKKYRSFLSFR